LSDRELEPNRTRRHDRHSPNDNKFVVKINLSF
jgi:hypothetical protein